MNVPESTKINARKIIGGVRYEKETVPGQDRQRVEPDLERTDLNEADPRARDQRRSHNEECVHQGLTLAGSHASGSTASPPVRISKCRWLPVERPVLPMRAITWPTVTVSPFATSNALRWP